MIPTFISFHIQTVCTSITFSSGKLPRSDLWVKEYSWANCDLQKRCRHWTSSWHIFSKDYLFIFDCAGSLFLRAGFSGYRQHRLLSSCGVQASHCHGFACWGASAGSRCRGSIVVAHSLSCPEARGIFPGQGWNRCPLHWQADSWPVDHQGSPPHDILWQPLIGSFSQDIFWLSHSEYSLTAFT